MKSGYISMLTIQNSIFLLIRPIVITPLSGFVLKHSFLLLAVPCVIRVIFVIFSHGEWTRVALMNHVLLSIGIIAGIWYMERLVRINYRVGYQHRNVKKDREMLEKVAQVRGAEVQEQAETNAASEVTGCFNTLLTAALEMQAFLDNQAEENTKKKQQKEKKESKERNSTNEKTKTTTTTTTTLENMLKPMSDSKRQHCFEMLTEAQDDFIFLQKTRDGRHLEINPFLVRIMLENASRVFQYGNRRTVINVVAKKRLCFDSSVAYLRQILHQLMRALADSDGLELEGLLVDNPEKESKHSNNGDGSNGSNGNDSKVGGDGGDSNAGGDGGDGGDGDKLLRLGVRSKFHLDLMSVQESRPDLVAFSHGAMSEVHGGLLDVMNRVARLGGKIVSRWTEVECSSTWNFSSSSSSSNKKSLELSSLDTKETEETKETKEIKENTTSSGKHKKVKSLDSEIGGGDIKYLQTPSQTTYQKFATTLTVHIWIPNGIGRSMTWTETTQQSQTTQVDGSRSSSGESGESGESDGRNNNNNNNSSGGGGGGVNVNNSMTLQDNTSFESDTVMLRVEEEEELRINSTGFNYDSQVVHGSINGGVGGHINMDNIVNNNINNNSTNNNSMNNGMGGIGGGNNGNNGNNGSNGNNGNNILLQEETYNDIESIQIQQNLQYNNFQQQPEERRRTLLLVDDNHFTLDVTEMQLNNFLEAEGYGFVDIEACSTDVLQHLCANDDYDFVMMDLNFPGTPENTGMLPGK